MRCWRRTTNPERYPVSSCEAYGRPLVSEADRCPDCDDRPAVAPPLGPV